MLYCYIENGQLVEGPKRLPNVWRNVSGLNLLSDASLKAKGWLPYIDVKPAYDKDTQYLTQTRTIGEDDVMVNYTVNDYTAEEMATRLLSAQTARKTAIRGECETKILSVYPLWMQVNGANGLDPLAEVDTMLADIGAMRTESNDCEDLVDAAETLAAVRAIEPTWPIEAEVI